MWTNRFKRYSFTRQNSSGRIETDGDFGFTVPAEFIIEENFNSNCLFHGGIDSPSLNCFDPILKRYVQITKYLCFNSKTTTQKYIDDLYERIVLTSELSHVNVRQILSWYIADACIYSVTDVLRGTLRQAIESEYFSIDRIQLLAFQIVQGTLYLHSKGFCPLTPWYTTNIELTVDNHIRLCSPTIPNRKLNGASLDYHHLWRHAPETLIRMILKTEFYPEDETLDRSKEDVWSIGCIIVEMLINRIVFRPQNDEAALQILCIVQLVGGLSNSTFERFPSNLKKILRKIGLDQTQSRLERFFHKIFECRGEFVDEKHFPLIDCLRKMFQFCADRRISLGSLVEEKFFSISPMKKFESIRKPKTPVCRDEIVRLCVKLNLKKARWFSTLKELCLFELIFNATKIRSSSLEIIFPRSIRSDVENFRRFLTGSD